MKRLVLDERQFRRLCMVVGVPEKRLRGDCRRVEVRVPAKVALVTGRVLGTARETTLRDVSRQGVTLIHPTPIPPETCVALFLGGEADPIRVVGVTTESKTFADGTALVSAVYTGLADPRAAEADESRFALT